MPAGVSRPRPSGRASFVVTVASPDGGSVSTRGLAAWLTKAAPAKTRGEVTVAIISDGRMRALNRSFRGKDYATDVLAFPASLKPGPSADAQAAGFRAAKYLGDIVIASDIAKRQAREAGHSVNTELRILALHGLLHLLGHDHDTDAGHMARLELKLRKKAGLKEGLIERSRQ
jgi:probable rRNA maturation factor